MALCKENWTLVKYHRWERFCVTPKENTYVELQRKQIIGWNQRRKEKIDVLALLKRKEQVTAWKGTSRSTEEKLDGMIRWMRVRWTNRSSKEKRTIMRRHFYRNTPHQRGPSSKAQPDMHLQRVGAPTKDIARGREK
ncbi:hypothetical protein Gogos_020481 [Gossypium gossypioides]|uniref:Uncharacterized protein n=1 Tax=Gossypium gossypioides TaxID=34282 RepID=A0A7J9CZZ2_GOSGO|nr:hypothetical protein [Gossypium gossypioides]